MITEISRAEQNSHYDQAKCNNGGGYSQPLITFEYNGKIGTINDTSCGDFGDRYTVEYDGKYYTYDNASNPTREETNLTANDAEFVEEFNKAYPGRRIRSGVNKKMPEWANSETLINSWNHPTAEAWVEEHGNKDTEEHIFVALDTSGCNSGVIGIFENFENASNAVGDQEGFSDLWVKFG
jgi:hypothetical protein